MDVENNRQKGLVWSGTGKKVSTLGFFWRQSLEYEIIHFFLADRGVACSVADPDCFFPDPDYHLQQWLSSGLDPERKCEFGKRTHKKRQTH